MPNEIQGLNNNRTNQQNLFKDVSELETLNGAFKDGDTSPKQCRLKDISIHEAEKMFNEIDTDKNHKLSWDEICDNRDKECKHLKRSNIVKAVLFGPFYTKKYVNNKYLIKEYQRETQSYREKYDGTFEKELSNLSKNKDVKLEEEIQKLKQKTDT